MNKKALWLCTVFLMLGMTVYSQCNQHLVEIAAEQAGTDAIYIRDFKVKLSVGNMDNPSPTGKFPVFLNKGVNYRFTVANAEEFQGKAIVEIVRRGQTYTGNYNFDTKNYQNSFDFECPQSSTYQILINFGEGKEGCAALVMSMVLQDSMTYIEPGIPAKSDSNGVMYLWADNKMQIASTAGKDAELHVSVSQGSLNKQGKYYIVRPETTGELNVMARVLLEGKEVEKDSITYRVEIPPLPSVILPGESFGVLYLKNFSGFGQVELSYPVEMDVEPYILKQFSISTDREGFNSIYSNGDKLSPQQINLIRKLKPNDKIYIINTILIDPEGKEHQAVTREILIVE
jgi:hypothetical protein